MILLTERDEASCAYFHQDGRDIFYSEMSYFLFWIASYSRNGVEGRLGIAHYMLSESDRRKMLKEGSALLIDVSSTEYIMDKFTRQRRWR